MLVVMLVQVLSHMDALNLLFASGWVPADYRVLNCSSLKHTHTHTHTFSEIYSTLEIPELRSNNAGIMVCVHTYHDVKTSIAAMTRLFVAHYTLNNKIYGLCMAVNSPVEKTNVDKWRRVKST